MTRTPLLADIDARTGASSTFAEHYRKSFADVADIYHDSAAAAGIDPDLLAYEVFSNTRTGAPGELVFGTSVLMPFVVADEYSMTRGHLHQITDRAEVYLCLSGDGALLMEDLDGQTVCHPLSPGSAVYVPGGWVHRSVNVGTSPLVTLFCFSSDAGQDYSVIEESGGMAKRVVVDADHGWALVDNPNYRRRTATRSASS